MKILLIRHGETDLNRARVLQPPDTPLSKTGQQQAVALAVRLRETPIVRIISSDLTRAAQTAAPIAELSGVAVEYSALLHERNFGDLRGKAYSELADDPIANNYQPPGGESWAQFRQRVDDAFSMVTNSATESEGVMLVVSHGLVVREIISTHLACEPPMPERFENTCITEFDAVAPHQVSLLACHEHVRDLVVDGGMA